MLNSVQTNKKRKKIIRRITFLFGLFLSIAALIYGWFFILPGLFFICFTVFIKDISLNVFEDRIEINHIGIIEKLNIKEIFNFKDIQSVKFDEGFTNIIGAILDVNNMYFNRTYSKKDTVEIFLLNGEWRIVNRIGSRSEFNNACKIIIKELNKRNDTSIEEELIST